MGESLSAWLSLRERADFAARSEGLTRLIAARIRAHRPLRILDLGTGTGSNIRYLSPRLDAEQSWLVVDKDPRLLAELDRRTGSLPGVEVRTVAVDLNEPPAEIFAGRHLVTASALLDLVSESWLAGVADACRQADACALFTITYNGRNECDPFDPDDAAVFEWFNRHQLTDKGLGGPSVGPRGTDVARRCFRDAGYDVHVEPSDWHIGPDEPEFQRQLIDGWALAAAEIAPAHAQMIEAWRGRRQEHVAAGRSSIIVGHHDLAAITRTMNHAE